MLPSPATSAEEKSEYHHNGQLMMLKNRLENMEREKERLAATTRDQLIAKEKHYAAELREKDYHIRQLEAQIQSLRQENLHTSFQVHNVTMSENVDIQMAAVDTTPATGSALPTKRVSIPRSDEGWKNVSRFGPAASVFGNVSTSDRFRNENGSETFAQIPSQLLIDPPVPHSDFRVPASVLPVTLQPRKSLMGSASKECQVQGVSDYWNVSHSSYSMSGFKKATIITQYNNPLSVES
ncbi:unnamed protein product [Heligmosomoides polygyrus]|uniref:CCDC92 domain-containing protein n=1 Tax=Heligmosomoides polygyrus TaxID=6339 RepID=A0A183GTQ0_HELPZ|nr:unnamed protein product [Heligmosomoides polygyrus]